MGMANIIAVVTMAAITVGITMIIMVGEVIIAGVPTAPLSPIITTSLITAMATRDVWMPEHWEQTPYGPVWVAGRWIRQRC